MNGETELKTIKDRKAHIKKTLNDMKTNWGIVGRPNIEVQHILSLERDDLKRMTLSECCENAFILESTSFYIQEQINLYTAYVHWATSNIDAMCCKHLEQYGNQFTQGIVKRNMFIRDNAPAQELQKIVIESQQRIDALSYLPTRMNAMSRTLKYFINMKQGEQT